MRAASCRLTPPQTSRSRSRRRRSSVRSSTKSAASKREAALGAGLFAAVELVALDLRDEAFAADAELAGELGLVPAMLAQAFHQHAALDLFEDLVERLFDAHAAHVRAHGLVSDALREDLGRDHRRVAGHH